MMAGSLEASPSPLQLTTLPMQGSDLPQMYVLPRAPDPQRRASPDTATLRSGTLFHDTAGRVVHVHGAGVLLPHTHPAGEGGKHFLIGSTQKTTKSWLSEGINLYSSYDLAQWTLEGEVFHNVSITTPFPKWEHPRRFRIERPKLIYNKKTKRYVIYFHLDDGAFTIGMVGVCTSPTVTGPYTFVRGYRPDGQRSLDMTLFQEVDGTAYLVRSVDNKFTGISRLTDDYMNTTGIISRAPRCEGHAMWRDADDYFLLCSGLTGWQPNPAILARASAPLDGAAWSALGNPADDATTFNSQPTFVLPYVSEATGKRLHIYLGDRWNQRGPCSVWNASYVWLPLVRDGGRGYSLKGLGNGGDGTWRVADYLQ